MTLELSNESVRDWIRDDYSAAELSELRRFLRPATRITLTAEGFLRASDRSADGSPDPTNYDAVWVRDSVWAYLGMKADPESAHRAPDVLRGLLRYYASPKQLERLRNIIASPERALDPQHGPMEVLHVRFDPKSPELDDVYVDGKPQRWNHKQNDALGLFYDFTWRALLAGELDPDALTDAEWEVMLRLPSYFAAIGYDDFADAGAWEEIERINTSSVGLVVSALETADQAVRNPVWMERLQAAARRLGLDPWREQLTNGIIGGMIAQGYDRLDAQIPYESPDHPKRGPRYREADAALLSLIYPARLRRLSVEPYRWILDVVGRLVRAKGVLRYERDAYQGGNYWLTPSQSPSTEVDSRTDDASGEAEFKARARRLIPGTEAQWFFDSWLSKVEGMLYRRTKEETHRQRQIWFFHRALAQLTGGTEAEPCLGADGKPVPAFSLPESYNTLVDEQGRRRFAPSPITPLNWAKCSLLIALDELERTCRG